MTDTVGRMLDAEADVDWLLVERDRLADERDMLREALREARKALRYWGPVTGHGFSEKARIGAIIDAALGEDAK